MPAASSGRDNCGYPSSDFNESVVLCAINAQGGGNAPAQIQVFYNDEWPMTLGCATSSHPVSPISSNPSALTYPETGDPSCTDTAGRPLRPVLFITDITTDPNCRAGDQQQGGKAYNPVAIFGGWEDAKMASDGTGTPNRTSFPENYWTLGPKADPVPKEATDSCPCTEGSCETRGHTGRGFGAELRFEAGLISGHSYRLQVMMHDGDQTQGGDSAEACAIFCAGTGTCTPLTCGTACGQVPDGCGGILDCGPCEQTTGGGGNNTTGGAGTGGGDSTTFGGHAGYGGEPNAPACLAEGESCTDSSMCCNNVCSAAGVCNVGIR